MPADHFHHDFWVADAAAAPLIALGYTVLFASMTDVWASFFSINVFRFIDVSERLMPKTGWKRASASLFIVTLALPLYAICAAVPFLIVFSAVYGTIQSMHDALISLSAGRDRASMSKSTGVLTFSLAVLLAWPAIQAAVKGLTKYPAAANLLSRFRATVDRKPSAVVRSGSRNSPKKRTREVPRDS